MLKIAFMEKITAVLNLTVQRRSLKNVLRGYFKGPL